MRTDMCTDMCTGICTDKCNDMRADICKGAQIILGRSQSGTFVTQVWLYNALPPPPFSSMTLGDQTVTLGDVLESGNAKKLT